MRAYSVFLFMICLNLSAYMLNYAQVLPSVNRQLYWSPFDVLGNFNLMIAYFGALGVGGAIIGLAALLTRQYVYAAGALIVWVIGIVFPFVQSFIIATPIILGYILEPYGLSWISTIVSGFFAFIIFWFLVEFAAQRQIQ